MEKLLSTCRCCPWLTFLPQTRALFLSISRFSQGRASPVTPKSVLKCELASAGDGTACPSSATSASPCPPELGSLGNFESFAKAPLRDSRLSYKMTGKSQPNPDSQSEAQKSHPELKPTARICILSYSPKPCNEAFRTGFLNFSTGTVFMDYLNIKIYSFLEKNHFSPWGLIVAVVL